MIPTYVLKHRWHGFPISQKPLVRLELENTETKISGRKSSQNTYSGKTPEQRANSALKKPGNPKFPGTGSKL